MNFRVSCLILSCLLALSSCAAQGEELSPAPVAATPSAAAATPSPTPTPTPTPTPVITQAQLDQAVAQAGSDHGAMAVQAAVIRDGEVVLESAWGWAVRDSVAMTPQHKLRCASLTKVAVGLSAALLLDQGLIDPEADLSTYWGSTVCNPYYPDDPVTIDTLLTHTSSLSDSSSLSALKGSAARQRLAGSGFQSLRPGDPASWGYNNYGFSVLGMTLELAAQQPLDQVLGEGLLEPMGIDAAFEGGSVDNTDLLATLYYYGGSLARSTSEQRSYTLDYAPGHKGNFFDGGFTCSAGDLAKLAAVLANDGAYEGQVLLSPESVAWMETPLDTPVSDGRSTFLQCRPLRYQEELYGREGLYYHTGSAYGQYALLSYDPDTGDGVVVLTSGADGVVDEHGIYAICGEIAQAVYAAVEEDT